MDFFYGIVALLAFVVLILTALMAWMYVQQTRLMQAVSALTAVISAPPPSFLEATKEYPHEEPEPEDKPEPAPEDDRVSVQDEDDKEKEEDDKEKDGTVVEDDLSEMKISQIRDQLRAKGIPFNKSDKKPVLLSLLKVASA
jgi:cytoskeletal protein RodZ